LEITILPLAMKKFAMMKTSFFASSSLFVIKRKKVIEKTRSFPINKNYVLLKEILHKIVPFVTGTYGTSNVPSKHC